MNGPLALLSCVALSSCLAHVAVGGATAQTANWEPTTWRGERAFALATERWRAVVSVERGRLVHFGPAEEPRCNLLFETETRDDPFSWGGHRVWLGPQALWGWPPPEAWERAAAANVAIDGARLELTMPDAGRGFPRLRRIYEVSEGRLACRVAVAAGGTEAVQVMQILQTPRDTVVELTSAPSAAWPRGYCRVGGAVGPVMVPSFPLPAGVTERGTAVRVEFAGRSDKLAFPPQTLAATARGRRLMLAFGESRGAEVAAPDAGFFTQVYIGDPQSPVVEIEQLSPQWAAGAAGEFSMYLELAAES
ncbi:MAG TPA: hypothetical protein VK163_12890 [Opitutaceae bacterium]|nr:hypothetical protein [Opitutaceae bacterium]